MLSDTTHHTLRKTQTKTNLYPASMPKGVSATGRISANRKTEMEAPADRSVTKELMTDTNVTVLKISDRSAGVSGVAHRSVTV